MKKNIIIIVLAVVVVMFGLYAFAQKVKADQAAAEAIRQNQLKEEFRSEAEVAQREAHVFREISEAESVRTGLAEADARRLQQLLDKCKQP